MSHCYRVSGLLLCFFAAFALASIYNLNLFYWYGSGLLDNGWFAYLSTHSDAWPIKNPADIGPTYFSTHFSPIFYGYTAIYNTLVAIGIKLPAPTFFSLTQGFWYGLFSASIFQLIEGRLPARGWQHTLLYVAIALICAFNGVALAALVFPHFEIAIPVLFTAYFACALGGHQKLALALLGLGLLVREDAGLHYFGLFFVLGIYLCFFGNDPEKQGRKYLYIAAVCFAYAGAAIAFQKINFSLHDNALGRVYTGTPPYQHVTAAFIRQRLSLYINERAYIYVPFILWIGYACVSRNWLFILGLVSTIPWVCFSFFGIQFLAGSLAYYYAFPILIAFIWPLVAAYLAKGPNSGRLAVTWVAITTCVACLSIAAFYNTPYLEDNKPWHGFVPRWSNAHKQLEALEAFFAANAFSDNVAVQDPVAALVPEKLNRMNWAFLMEFSKERASSIQYVVFYSKGKPIQVVALEKFTAQNGLDAVCTIQGTEYNVAYKGAAPALCMPNIPPQ